MVRLGRAALISMWMGLLVSVLIFQAGVAEGASSYQEWESAYTQSVQAGPYDVLVHYTQWPVRSLTNQRFVVEVEGGIAGKSGRWRWIPVSGVNAEGSGFRSLRTYPGIENAWVVDVAGMVDPGEWRWIIEINGPSGRAVGRSDPYTVEEPPGFPIWLGWLLGLFPLYGLIWFAVREARRTRLEIGREGRRA